MNTHATIEEKSDGSKEELQKVFRHFRKCRIKILLGNFNTKLEREDIFKPTVRNESLHQDIDANGVRTVKFAIPKKFSSEEHDVPHRNIHKYTWISHDGHNHNQTEHISIDRYEIVFESTLCTVFKRS